MVLILSDSGTPNYTEWLKQLYRQYHIYVHVVIYTTDLLSTSTLRK